MLMLRRSCVYFIDTVFVLLLIVSQKIKPNFVANEIFHCMVHMYVWDGCVGVVRTTVYHPDHV